MTSENSLPRIEDNTIINNIMLSEQQIAELEKMYGKKPKPGRYWYDKVSGLFGLKGQPALGFMYPGHDFGVLARDASCGNTQVFINGRELTQAEYMILCNTVGNMVFPGSYWLDVHGNAGIEGNSFPMINLFAAAQQRGHQNSGGGGGDNFWTSRFSAGNYTDDGSAGYVSVPGYGPVSYGM